MGVLDSVFDGLLLASWGLLGLVLFKVVFFISFSSRHHWRHKRLHPRTLEQTPLVSIIVPAWNEGKTLENCIKSLVNQGYPNLEIIIVNDGSTDTTLLIARRLASQYRPRIRLINRKANRGKAAVLNRGIAQAKGEIVVCIDADSIFLENTVEQLVLTFHNPDVAAVCGNVRVANRKKLLNKQQALEYITGLTIQRKAFAHLECMQVISGAIGAFRRQALLEVGGYSSSTVVEDMDITIELGRRGYKVDYNPLAIAYTEAPETLSDFLKQRFRWTYGSLQVLVKHRESIWGRGRLGSIGMPYFMIFPWLDVLISTLFFVTITRAIVAGQLRDFLIIISFMAALQTSLITYALIIDKEDKKFIMLALVDAFLYYHLISFTTLRAGIRFLRKRQMLWTKLERYGRNISPVPAPVPVTVDSESKSPINAQDM